LIEYGITEVISEGSLGRNQEHSPRCCFFNPSE
jgi:hypothetical protein